MTSTDEYRAAKSAQDGRYESLTGLPVGDTNRQEYRDYFGVGDYAGTPTETRINYKQWLRDGAGQSEDSNGCITDRQAFYMSGAALAELAGQGDYVAAGEIVRRVVKRAAKKVAA